MRCGWNIRFGFVRKLAILAPSAFVAKATLRGGRGKDAEVDVNDVKIAADGAVTLIVDGLVVYGVPSISKLVLDYPILREINLAWFANQALGGQRLAMINASKLVAALPYINSTYVIDTLAVSGSGEIRADITIKNYHRSWSALMGRTDEQFSYTNACLLGRSRFSFSSVWQPCSERRL